MIFKQYMELGYLCVSCLLSRGLSDVCESQEVQFYERPWNMLPVTSSSIYQSDDGDSIIMGWSPSTHLTSLGLGVSHWLKTGQAQHV